MMWSAYLVGTIIGVWGPITPPPGWLDITGTDRCRDRIEAFDRRYPGIGQVPNQCLLKIETEPGVGASS